MGGYGAVRWGLRSPELFTVVAGLSAAVQQLSRRSVESLPFLVRPAFRRVFGDSTATGPWRKNDLAAILLDEPGLAGRAPELLLRCGTEDKYLLSDVGSYFHKLVTALGGRSELVLEPGGHDWAYWRSVFVPFVDGRGAPSRPGRGGRMRGANSRLVLFDVDGTLLSSGRKGLESFSEALRRTFGTEGDVASYRFEGRLDPVIVFELMRDAGIPDDVIVERRPAALSLYLDLLEEALSAHPPALKPGVADLVARVSASPSVVPALLTGNVQRGARIKLTAAGLWDHFQFGVFGDEAPRRVDLGPIALARALERTGRPFSPSETVVVGDARADVECGRAIGARVVAVATGRTSVEELRRRRRRRRSFELRRRRVGL